MNKTNASLLSVLLVALAILVWYLVGQDSVTPPSTCVDNATCPDRPAGILEKGVIIDLKNFYTLDDVLSKGGDFFTVGVCDGATEPSRNPSGRNCKLDTFYTGRDTFLRKLNNIIVGAGNPPKITTLDGLEIRTCKCAREIFYMDFPEGLWDDVNVEHRVASGTSKSEEESSSIGAIGFNLDLSATMAFSNAVLQGARDSAPKGPCGFKVSPAEYKPGTGKVPDEKQKSDFLRQKEILDGDQAGKWGCAGITGIDLALAPGHPGDTNMVTVAVIDTGVDPYYDYANPPGSPVQLDDFFAFSPEVDALGTGVVDLTMTYGDSIPHDGVDANGNCLPGDYYGWDYYGEDNNPADRNGHGTHVASIILGANDAASHPVRIVPLQFGDQDDNGNFDGDLFAAICAINYAVERKVDIINLSWGYSSLDTNQVLYEQMIAAHAADILVVASAGNDSVSVDGCKHWPSNFSTFPDLGTAVISVAALDDTDGGQPLQLADYSNFGQSVDLAAPGTNIEGALIHTGNGYVTMSGTSMAAAFVSARAAELKVLDGTRLSALQLKASIFLETTVDTTICIGGSRIYDRENAEVMIQ